MSKRIKRPILLLATDNPSIRHWIKKELDPQFFIIEATTRKDALETVKTSSLDLIILDANFPDEKILKLCAEIKSLLSNRLTPILLMTGKLKKSFRDQALSAGVTDFLNIQLDSDELETRIATGKHAQEVIDKTIHLAASIPKQKELPENFLKNKFLLHDHAIRMLVAKGKEKVPVALLTIQIDRFHQIEKERGYKVIEEILLPLSQRITRIIDEADLLIPSTDGQFILLLNNQRKKEAEKTAEKLQNEVQKTPFENGKKPLYLTISTAISSITSERDLDKMVESAFKALKQVQDATNLILSLDLEKP